MNFHHDTPDLRRLRDADADRGAETARAPEPMPAEGRRWPGITVVVTTYPQTINAFYWVQPMQITGDEVEGGPATVATVGDAVLCYNDGTAIPPVGSPVDVTECDYRRVFSWYG